MRTTAKRLAHVGIALMVIVGSEPDAAVAQTGPSTSGLEAQVGIRVTPNRRTGRAGGTSVWDDVLAGESSRHLNVAVGSGGDLCVSSVWSSNDDRQASPSPFVQEVTRSASHIWRYDISMIEVMIDRITFDLTWQRTSRGAPEQLLSQKQRITLREGETRPIDLLHGVAGSDCVSVVLEAIAGIVEDPALSSKAIEWDLWFSKDAQTATVHRSITSGQGQATTFAFEPVATTATQFVHLYGQLRGRVRSDGSIDVAVSTERVFGRVPIELPRQLGPAGGWGQKSFALKSGEAVKIVLPPVGPITVSPLQGQSSNTPPAASEMSITIQARVR